MAPAEQRDAAGYRLSAPAKLNLYLHVTGRRDDGYHLLDSLVAFAAVGDAVELTPADDFSLAVGGRFAAALDHTAADDNLVMRAARLLRQEAGLADHIGAAIRLEKRLPVAAGLGGGSSDAAAALHGLCALWGIAPDADDLLRIAMALGADVPVCLAPRPTFVGGIGDQLDPAPALPALHVALVNPAVPLSTASVFAALGACADHRRGRFESAPLDAAGLAGLLASRDNDLEIPARGLCPEIDAVIRALARQPDCLLARMSGSGATCFGLFATAVAALAAARSIAEEQQAWWVSSGPLLSSADEVAISPIPSPL